MPAILLLSPSVFGEGIVSYLAKYPEFVLFHLQWQEPRDILMSFPDYRPDCTIVDATSIDFELFVQAIGKEQLAQFGRLIIISAEVPDDAALFQWLLWGCFAWFDATSDGIHLVKMLARVSRGECLLWSPAAAHIPTGMRLPKDHQFGRPELIEPEQPLNVLSRREQEILTYIAQGEGNKLISQRLKISDQTVKNYMTSILRKLDASNRTRAVVVAIQRNLIQVPGFAAATRIPDSA